MLIAFSRAHKKSLETARTGTLDVGGGTLDVHGGTLDVQNGRKSVIFGTFLERNPSRSSSIRQLSL